MWKWDFQLGKKKKIQYTVYKNVFIFVFNITVYVSAVNASTLHASFSN